MRSSSGKRLVRSSWSRVRGFATSPPMVSVRIGAQATRVRRRIGFIEAEFIKIIVTGDLIFRGKRQISLPLGGFSKLWALPAGAGGRSWPLNQSSRSACAAAEGKRGRADTQHFQHRRRLSIKTDSAVTSASVSFFFSWCPPSCVFLSMTETAMNGEYVTKNCTLG